MFSDVRDRCYREVVIVWFLPLLYICFQLFLKIYIVQDSKVY